MLGTARLLLALAIVRQTLALSSHSPRDLEALPAYAVSLAEHGILNDTIADLLAQDVEASSHPYPLKRHLLRTPSGQAFLCTVPAATGETKKQAGARADHDALVRARERERGVQHGLALLEPMRQGCLYLREGWFTYSFCYGNEIRQFHAYDMRVPGTNGPKEDPDADAYTLGMMPEPSFSPEPKYGSGRHSVELQVPTTLGGGDGLGWDEGGRYLSQVWDSGTICDKTGLPREVEVQYHCNTQTIDRIAHIRETSICRYVMLVHTPRLCGDPLFLEGHDKNQEPAATIECQPVVRRLQEQLPEQPAPAAVAPAPVSPVPVDQPPHHASTAAGAVDDDDLDLEHDVPRVDLQTTLDELLDTEGTLTLVYDPDSGEIESIVSDLGEDVFVDSDLKKQLFADMVQAAIGGADGEDGSDGVEKDDRHSDDDAPVGREKTTEESLENLAKLMHDTLAEALRAHAHPANEQRPPAPPGDAAPPAAAAPDPIASLLDVIRRATNPPSSDAERAAKPAPPMHPGLHKYLEGFSKEKRTVRVPPEAILGSEAHERLRARFARRYEAEEGEQEGAAGGEGDERTDPRDEL
ncbi:uncharacterized protein RHOBADRAFT_52530 [Rhodotorula graminis WP1]|uniref:Protein OS-9 homolog n=1 Tax=Rhodotorula graminis (strain WP1) TaxID=578459 RepID=A0A194SAW2_RHOGW|nr:uncharacterized protein RHOBADRAFT_52530 [Rhodotorula graminis WP1]KPV76536.1 hypothetical protein RHOBADRAFT_52530 [Rhodotorula graminis WP1]